MKVLKYLLILTVFILAVSCTKKVATYEQVVENGIKITKNTGVPADSTFKIELKEVAFIENDSEADPERYLNQPTIVDFDEAGNIYIFDRTKYMIFKYDQKGSFIMSFGQQGQGPGEFIQPGTIIVREDTLYVTEIRSYKISKFNLDGEFLGDKKFPDIHNFPMLPSKFGENYITVFGATKSIVTDEGKRTNIKETSLYDQNFDFIKNLHILEYEPPAEGAEFDPTEKGIQAAASDINAYVYEHSKTQYKIDVYDINGNKVREIRKYYSRIKTPLDFHKKYEEIWAKQGRKYKSEFRNSIYQLRTDKYNRLWVSGPTNKEEEGYYYDIFENDIFINRVKPVMEEGYGLLFVADKIIGYNSSENKIKIYEY
ncbi:MAG TPA: 6-bladed beta-propeller [Clostridiales bacterium]|nr:6-bladed beta-propeller [Clostridiales bacterium]HQP69207.1 6-bladed beta-propeller [Clostridiales bacterium]